MEQKKIEPIRDARKLGKAKMLILGIQHMFAMFGATILVPILVSKPAQKSVTDTDRPLVSSSPQAA